MKKGITSVILAIMAVFMLAACSEVSEIKDSLKSSKETLSEVKETVSNIKDGKASVAKDELKDFVNDKAESTDFDELIDEVQAREEGQGLLSSTEDVNLTDTGDGKHYTFTYGDEEFSAIYTEDNWKILDSYKITNVDDNYIICQALIDEHPIHGSDMASYRTAEDMAYEWLQHNIAYEILPDDNAMKSHAKDVDFDPKDQGKDFDEIYEDRTGKEFSLDNFGF
ncbi:MAG: hypothetical protein E7302_01225 [Butyrivibrio sp.]|nr:hypothetical protein [Butyrivibrio sp.]